MISIIVPCFNEESALPRFYEALCPVMGAMKNESFEILLVDDGSRDFTLAVMKKLAQRDRRITYLSFSRNFGKEAAIYAGLKNASGDYTVIMDADLQDPPSLLPEMYRFVSEEGYDSAATRRVTRRGEPPVRSFFARMFYKLMNRISKANIVDGARDYRMMNRKYTDAILRLGEYNRFSKGMFGWVGFSTKWLEFENIQRVAGESKWCFWSLFRYSMEGILAFSAFPLLISSYMGIASCLGAFVFMLFILIRRLCFGDPVAGWASIVTIVLFLGGTQLLCIGILGQYLSRTYLETKKRPIYLIRETNRDTVTG